MNQNNLCKSNKTVFIILAIYTVLLVAFTILNYDFLIISDDTESYVSVAENLIAGKGFANAEGLPDGFRTPGYPLFIAAVLLLGGNVLAVVIVQLILCVGALYLTYRTCIITGLSEKYALVCTGLFLLDLSLYIYSATAISDAFFYFVLVVCAYFLAKFTKTKKFIHLVLFFIALNFALSVRPILMYYNGLVCIFILVLFFFKKASIKSLLVSVLAFALVFGGWSLRNYVQNGVFEMSYVRNYNMTQYDGAVLRSELEGITLNEARDAFDREFSELHSKEELEGLSRSQIIKMKSEVGNGYIKAHFFDYLKQNVKGLFNTMFGTNRSFLNDSIGSPLIITLIELCYLAFLFAVYALYVMGWIFNFKKANALDLFIFTVSGYCAAASASLGYARFRVAFFGLILLGAFLLWKDKDIISTFKEFLKRKNNKKAA